MRCAKTGIPMGIEDLKNNIYGFQFHPESFLTENGNFIIKKILSSTSNQSSNNNNEKVLLLGEGTKISL